MAFTIKQAFEAQETGQPIMLDQEAVETILRVHDQLIADFYRDYFADGFYSDVVDAAELFVWLGY